MARKSGLGKGLGALLPESPSDHKGYISSYVPVSKIIPNPRQPRYKIQEESLEELAASIREHGILQPLLVSHEQDTDRYVLIAGERRLKAAILAGLDVVPVIERQTTEQERLELALIENVQRADLTPLETAEAYRQLSEDFNLSHEDIAARVGKKRTTITNTLRLLKLPPVIIQALIDENITEGHARALLGIENADLQKEVLDNVIKLGLNVRQTEQLVRRINTSKKQSPKPLSPSPEIKSIEDRLRNHFGTKITLKHNPTGKGSLIIHYYSNEELESIISLITKE